MDLFDVKRRDVLNFDNYMDLKKPEFGGPKSAEYARDAKGKTLPKNPKTDRLEGYTRVVERDPLFASPHYNSTYKAMTHDLVYKQAGKEPFNYRDPYDTGLPVVEVGEYEDVKEQLLLPTFETFTNTDVSKSGAYIYDPSKKENIEGSIKATVEINDNVEKVLTADEKTLNDLKKKEKDVLTEGTCSSSFDSFITNEHWEDDYAMAAPAEVETEEEIEIDTPSTPGKRPWSPTRPPRRDDEELPGPKNRGAGASMEAAINDLANYLGISTQEASNILGAAMISGLENEDGVELTGDEEEVSDYITVDQLGAGPECYGEGPMGCEMGEGPEEEIKNN